MPIEEILGHITQRLRKEDFPNEQSISQGIVLPVLQELHWPVFETNFVRPEYATGEGRVDFALCDPHLVGSLGDCIGYCLASLEQVRHQPLVHV